MQFKLITLYIKQISDENSINKYINVITFFHFQKKNSLHVEIYIIIKLIY